MKSLKLHIQEAFDFKLGDDNFKSRKERYKYFPKDRDELKEILKERLNNDKNADLNDINVLDIKDMATLFWDFDPHNINISEWDVSGVENMEGLFYYCKNFDCDLSKWNVSNVESMDKMFYRCEKFKGKGLENWDISNVKNMEDMFEFCNSLKNKPSWYKPY